MNIKSFKNLFVSIFVCFLAGIIGSVFTYPSIQTWYVTIRKPFFTPPNWIFGPVWTLLYLMMAVSLFLFIESSVKTKEFRKGIFVFSIQLLLNVIWSITFFGLKDIFAALLVILVLLMAILLTFIEFNKYDRNSALLLLPYLFWVSFAFILNLSLWLLN